MDIYGYEHYISFFLAFILFDFAQMHFAAGWIFQLSDRAMMARQTN